MIEFPGIGRHRRVRGLLSAYIDGEVIESEARRVEGHLALCGECRRELDTLRSTVDLLNRLPELAVPRSFALPEALAPVASPSRFESLARLAAPVAAVLLVVLVVGDALGIVSQSSLGGPFTGSDEEAPAVEAEVVVEKEVVKEQEAAEGPSGAPGPATETPVVTARKQEVASAEVGPPDDVAPEGQWALVPPANGSGGIALPLWQIEIAVGVLLAALLAIAFRGWRRTGR